MVVELRVNRVAGTARSPRRLLCAASLVLRIAALDHKILDDPMKTGAVVKTRFGQFLEIRDGFGRRIRPELDRPLFLGGGDDSDFVGIGRLGRRCVASSAKAFCWTPAGASANPNRREQNFPGYFIIIKLNRNLPNLSVRARLFEIQTRGSAHSDLKCQWPWNGFDFIRSLRDGLSRSSARRPNRRNAAGRRFNPARTR